MTKPSGIRFAQIDPTSVCDLKCGFCVGRTWKQGHLKADHFESALRQLPHLKYVQLQGEGEPMLGKRFWSHLEALRTRSVDVGFTTNGRHLSASAVDRLASLGVRTITVSIDSLDPVVYQRMRGGDLDIAMDGLRRLAHRRPPSMDVFTATVLTRTTFPGFEEIVAMGSDLGLSPASCQPLQEAEAYTKAYRDGFSVGFDGLLSDQHEWVRTYLADRRRFRESHGLQTFFEAVEAASPQAPCAFLESSIHLRFDGELFPCCFIKESMFSIGSLDRDQLDGAPVRQARADMRREIQSGGTPTPCVGCHVLTRRA